MLPLWNFMRKYYWILLLAGWAWSETAQPLQIAVLPSRCNTEDCTDEIGYGSVRQGICPYGWRIPVADDWNALHLALAESNRNGVSKMKLANTPFADWNNTENDGNSFYFSAVPAGLRVANGGF